MKKLISILLILISFTAVKAENDDAEKRMLKYATLHQLFDACLAPIGISDINYMQPVWRLWDFDSFAGYILQEIPKISGVTSEECVMDSVSRTLTIPLAGVGNMNFPLPVTELTLSFESESADDNRSLVVTYEIKDAHKSLDELRQQCMDMLEGTSMVEHDGQQAYEGAFDHIYTLDEGPEKNSLLFSCHMPVPPRKWYTVSAGYSPHISYGKLPKSAPCNSGKEPFNKFLKKFNNDTRFRIDRRNFSDKAVHADYMDGHLLPIQFGLNEIVLEALDHSGLLPLRGHYDYREYSSRSDSGSKEYVENCGQWFYPTENSVIYSGWNASSESIEEDCGIIILFERIDEEWHTTATWFSGKRLGDYISRAVEKKYADDIPH